MQFSFEFKYEENHLLGYYTEKNNNKKVGVLEKLRYEVRLHKIYLNVLFDEEAWGKKTKYRLAHIPHPRWNMCDILQTLLATQEQRKGV